MGNRMAARTIKSLPSVERLPLIGAQISTAGGFAPVPGRALEMGAEAVQIFNSNPRAWRAQIRSPEEIATLVSGLRKHHIPLFFHTIYLINMAAHDDQLRERSIDALTEALVMGALTSAAGVVTHIGSHHGEGFPSAANRVIDSVETALQQALRVAGAAGGALPLPPLLLETGAGAGGTVGGRLEELETLIASLPQCCRLCLDTAHLFAAGYPLHTPSGLERVVDELERRNLLSLVGLVHLNDSKTPFASNRDRHENPGDGQIGFRGLARVVRHPALASVPFVLEVPGLEGHGPEAENVALVKTMREGARRPPREPLSSAGRQPTPE